MTAGTIALGELMATKKQSLDPRKTPERKFALYSIPAYDEGQPAETLGGEIGSSKQVLQSGDVLLSRIVPHIRRAWIVDADRTVPAVGSSEWIVFRGDGFHPPYLRHVLLSDPFHRQFMNTVAGVGGSLLRARPKYVARIEVPLPPLEEQRRIAVVLDAADELRAKRREALAKLDSLPQATFIDMFGSGGWPTSRLGDEVETTSGGTPSRRKSEFFEGSIPWVKSGEVAQGVVRDTEEHISAEAVAASSAKLMPPGTVLLAMYGATVGAVGELGIEATTNQAVCCITPSDTMSRAYLIGLLKSLKSELVAKGAGGAQPNISQTIIRDLRVPVPPVDAQAAYAARVQEVAVATERARKSKSGLDTLFGSLQQRAFRGEL